MDHLELEELVLHVLKLPLLPDEVSFSDETLSEHLVDEGILDLKAAGSHLQLLDHVSLVKYLSVVFEGREVY